MKLKIKKLIPDLDLRYHSDGASGIDLPLASDIAVFQGRPTCLIDCGFSVEIPEGYEGQIRPRSSSVMRGINVFYGTIDSDYRGQVRITVDCTQALKDCERSFLKLNKGERIAQLVICPVQRCEIEVVDELSTTKRGTGGFGSTGK